VPKPVRDRLHLHAGDKFDFVMQDDCRLELVVKKSALQVLKGLIAPPVTGVTLEDMEKAIAEGACGDVRD
jgi:bifunctional DNA-binding transcriptional regulator/antitoxin component of YhaV-PrlF toxin-antitoxin module